MGPLLMGPLMLIRSRSGLTSTSRKTSIVHSHDETTISIQDRHTDPVCPWYDFPGHKTLLPIDPHYPVGSNHSFLLQNRDIEQTWPKRIISHASMPHRRHLDNDDIAYSTCNYRTRVMNRHKFSGSRRSFYEEPESRKSVTFQHTTVLLSCHSLHAGAQVWSWWRYVMIHKSMLIYSSE